MLRSKGHDNPLPSCSAACLQKSWDAYRVSAEVESLLSNALYDLTRA